PLAIRRKDGNYSHANRPAIPHRQQENAARCAGPAGSIAECRLEPDTDERAAVLPAEVQRARREDRSVRAWFDRLSLSMRRWYCNWVAQPKSAAARVRRAEQIAEQLLSVMEAEHELPPALQLAFSRDSRALEGWRRMSPTCGWRIGRGTGAAETGAKPVGHGNRSLKPT